MNQMPPQMPQAAEAGNSMKWGVIAIVVIAILLAAWWMFMRTEAPSPQPDERIPTAATETPETTQTPEATGNADDIISALLSAQAEEALVANATDNDTEFVTSDADAVSEMNTLYNDNEF